jgi:hypothetical protein
METSITLSRKLDRVHAAIDGLEAVPVRVVWARPVTGRGHHVAFLDDRKVAVAMVPNLAALESASRIIAEEELDRRYCIAVITNVHSAEVISGNRYWDVETDRGRRRFLLREPGKNVVRITPDQLLLRDISGNRFEIPSIVALDPRSRDEIDKVL